MKHYCILYIELHLQLNTYNAIRQGRPYFIGIRVSTNTNDLTFSLAGSQNLVIGTLDHKEIKVLLR